MIKKNIVGVISVGVACFSVVVLVAAREEPRIRELTGDIQLAGRVVSIDGEPLDDVRVLVTTSYWDFSTMEHHDEEETIRADGEFQVARHNAHSVRLSFIKQGYFYQYQDFSASNRLEGRFGGYTDTDLVIVLEKKPEAALLDSMQGHLLADPDGPVAVVELVAGTRDAHNLRKAPEGLKLTKAYVALEVDATADGRVERKSRPSDSGMVSDKPLHGALAFSSPDSGFVAYTPHKPLVHKALCFREMREAPETGYTPRLEFTEETSDYVYFYCRVGGRFGKGRVTRPYFLEKGSNTVIAPITILLNPTGSRYVATDD